MAERMGTLVSGGSKMKIRWNWIACMCAYFCGSSNDVIQKVLWGAAVVLCLWIYENGATSSRDLSE